MRIPLKVMKPSEGYLKNYDFGKANSRKYQNLHIVSIFRMRISIKKTLFYYAFQFNPNLNGGGIILSPPPVGVFLVTPKRHKLLPWHLAAFSSILLVMYRPSLVFLTCPSLQILGKTYNVAISDFRISGQSLIKGNCHNSRTSDDIDMKFEPATKFDKRNKTTSKKLTFKSCPKIVTSLLFFQFMANVEQSGIPDCKRPDSAGIVRKLYISINSNLLSYKN